MPCDWLRSVYPFIGTCPNHPHVTRTFFTKISVSKECVKYGYEFYNYVSLDRRPDFWAQKLGCGLSVSALYVGDYGTFGQLSDVVFRKFGLTMNDHLMVP